MEKGERDCFFLRKKRDLVFLPSPFTVLPFFSVT